MYNLSLRQDIAECLCIENTAFLACKRQLTTAHNERGHWWPVERLIWKLLNKGFLLVTLKSSLRKFYGRHHDWVDRYGISVSQMTTDNAPLVVNTSRSFLHSWLITGFVTILARRASLVGHELLTLPEQLSSPPVISGVRVTRSLVLYVCFVDRCLSFCTFSFVHCVFCSSSIYGFWLPLCCLQTLLERPYIRYLILPAMGTS